MSYILSPNCLHKPTELQYLRVNTNNQNHSLSDAAIECGIKSLFADTIQRGAFRGMVIACGSSSNTNYYSLLILDNVDD